MEQHQLITGSLWCFMVYLNINGSRIAASISSIYTLTYSQNGENIDWAEVTNYSGDDY